MINLLIEQVAWEERQIRKRGEALVRQQFSWDAEIILNRKLQGALLGQYTLSDTEQTKVAEFNTLSSAARVAVEQALADNETLKQVLAYEQAVRDLVSLDLLINGRPEVPVVEEVLEERDLETGEVLVEYVAPVAAVPAIEPLAQTVEYLDEDGSPRVNDNPDYLAAISEQNAAQAVIAGSSADVVQWVSQRGQR